MDVDPLAGYGDQDRFSPYTAMWDEPAGIVDPAGLGLYDTNMLNTIHITAKRPPTPEPNWGAANWQGEGGMNIHWGGGYGHIHPGGGGSAGGANAGAYSSNMGAGTTEQLMPSPDQIRQLAKSFMDPPTKPGETGYETNFKGTTGDEDNETTLDQFGTAIGLADFVREAIGFSIKQPTVINFFSQMTYTTPAETISDFKLLKPAYKFTGKLFFLDWCWNFRISRLARF